MPTLTSNLSLTKPAQSETIDVDVINENMDIIDEEIQDLKDGAANIHKNPDATTGDIIDTHLTVGTRTGDCGEKSFTSGNSHTASGQFSACVGGHGNKVTEYDSACLGGYMNECTAQFAVCAGGYKNKCSGTRSACIGGYQNTTTGQYGICLGGNNNNAGKYQVKIGHYAKDGESHTDEGGVRSGDALIIGNGSIAASTQEVTRSNAFRVSYAGCVYGTGAYSSSGADYAEFFEWQDGNPDGEDRRGIFVTLDGEKIRPCNAGEYILGVVSSNPSVCGDSSSENWHGMYDTDIFGNIICYDNGEPIISPQYDPSKTYVPREKRPEWAAIGMLGKLIVADDGTCEPNGCCAPSQSGIATASETGYRVLSRIDGTHIKILMR